LRLELVEADFGLHLSVHLVYTSVHPVS